MSAWADGRRSPPCPGVGVVRPWSGRWTTALIPLSAQAAPRVRASICRLGPGALSAGGPSGTPTTPPG
eukprot:1832539-Alexandrium_andersonii.AAC.1